MLQDNYHNNSWFSHHTSFLSDILIYNVVIEICLKKYNEILLRFSEFRDLVYSKINIHPVFVQRKILSKI